VFSGNSHTVPLPYAILHLLQTYRQIDILPNIEYHLDSTILFPAIITHGLYRNLGRTFIWEHEHTCGYAAKRYTLYLILINKF